MPDNRFRLFGIVHVSMLVSGRTHGFANLVRKAIEDFTRLADLAASAGNDYAVGAPGRLA